MGRRNVSESTQSRRTGMILIALLAGIAGLALWREHPQRAAIWAGASVATAVLVFAAPRAWLAVWRIWLKVALVISSVITVVILGVCYFVIFTPVGLAMRLAGRDALGVDWGKKKDSYWVAREPIEATVDRYRKQF